MTHTQAQVSDPFSIPGYVYVGDVGSVADYGGKWIGVEKDTLGEVIEVIGAGDLDDGDENGAIILSAHLYISGHNEMRKAIESCGWTIRGTGPDNDLNRQRFDGDPAKQRAFRRALMLEAYHGYYGADTQEDFGGRYEERVKTDAEAIELANRWAR